MISVYELKKVAFYVGMNNVLVDFAPNINNW